MRRQSQTRANPQAEVTNLGGSEQGTRLRPQTFCSESDQNASEVKTDKDSAAATKSSIEQHSLGNNSMKQASEVSISKLRAMVHGSFYPFLSREKEPGLKS